jgi:hypothetical protein
VQGRCELPTVVSGSIPTTSREWQADSSLNWESLGPSGGVPALVAQIQQNLFPKVVDRVGKTLYNTHMEAKNTSRKKRVDRNHIIYELSVNGQNYIGVTAKTESTVLKSVRSRAAKHFYRAKTENKDWLLCAELRKLNSKDEIGITVHAVIRGKAEAHKEEVRIRRTVRPALNTDTRGD